MISIGIAWVTVVAGSVLAFLAAGLYRADRGARKAREEAETFGAIVRAYSEQTADEVEYEDGERR